MRRATHRFFWVFPWRLRPLRALVAPGFVGLVLGLGAPTAHAEESEAPAWNAAPRTDRAEAGGLQFITLEGLKQALAEGAHVLDANRPRTYARAHLAGAISVGGAPLTKAQLPENSDDLVVIYCASVQCPSSRMVARQALALGHRNVQVFKEGLKGWLAAGLPTEASPP